MKRIIQSISFLASVILSIGNGMAQVNPTAANDSITWSRELDEVVIEAPSIVTKTDRQLYLPKQSMVNASINGADLLSKMKIPEIVVNKLQGTISRADNGEITLCINGRPVKQEQINALLPKNIKRIEYHDHPSQRWGNAKSVIDFITVNPDSGGSAMLEYMGGINKPSYINHNGSFSIYKGHSEWNINTFWMNRQKFEMYRDNTETFRNTDGSYFTRTEAGEPGAFAMMNGNVNLNYNYTDSVQLFAINVGFWNGNNRMDFKGTITNSQNGQQSHVEDDNNGYGNGNQWVGFYYHRKFKGNQMLIANLGGSLGTSHSRRSYEEQTSSSDIFSTLTKINEHNRNAKLEVNYEKQWQSARFTAGASQWLGSLDTHYLMQEYDLHTDRGNTYFFMEYMKRFGANADVTVGLGTNYKYTKMEGSERLDSWSLEPRLRFHWRWSPKTNLNFSLQSYGNMPDVGQLSPVVQTIDIYQKSKGNAGLKNYRGMTLLLEEDYNVNRFYMQVGMKYVRHFNPIMEEKYYSEADRCIMSTFDNQKAIHWIEGYTNFRVEPIKEWLSFGGNVRYQRLWSEGNHYNHVFTKVACNVNAELTHYGFTLQWLLHRPYDSFWGETLSGDESFNAISLEYQIKPNLHVGIWGLNPFVGNYHVDSENRNELASFKRRMFSNAAQNLFVVDLKWNISWGAKKKNQDRQRIQNSQSGGGTTAVGK